MSILINLNNTAVKLEDLKAISVSNYTDAKVPTNYVVLHLKTRKEYIFNPNAEEWELETFNDTVEIEFYDHRTASAYQQEMIEEWEAFLK